MSELNALINQMCPHGVEYKPLWSILFFYKRFNGVDKTKQPVVLNFKHVSAEKLKSMLCDGEVKLLSTGKFEGWTNSKIADEYLNSGEVVSIPSGGAANIKYYKGLFVDGGNILCSSRDANKYDLKYIYYCLLKEIDYIQGCFRGGSVQHPEMLKIIELKIPVPPLIVQQEIAKTLDLFNDLSQSLIEKLSKELLLREKEYTHYLDRLLFDSSYSVIPMSELCVVNQGLQIPIQDRKTEPGPNRYQYLTVQFLKDGSDSYFIENPSKSVVCDVNDILVTRTGSTGKIITGVSGCFHNNFFKAVCFEDKIKTRYMYHLLSSKRMFEKLLEVASGGTVPDLPHKKFYNIKVPVPSVPMQEMIIPILDKYKLLFEAIQQNLQKEILLREKNYKYYLKLLLSFKELEA